MKSIFGGILCVMFILSWNSLHAFDANGAISKFCVEPPESVFACMAYIPSWRYDRNLDACVSFIYGGCGRDSNTFSKLEDCKAMCIHANKTSQKEKKPKENEDKIIKGNPKRRYGKRGRKPKKGEKNKKEIKKENDTTIEKAKPDVVDVCKQPKMVGPCKALMQRWYYNKDNDACEEFIFGGCKGNKNNFKSKDQCEEKCLKSS